MQELYSLLLSDDLSYDERGRLNKSYIGWKLPHSSKKFEHC